MCTMIKTLRNIYTMMKFFELITETEDVTDCDTRPTIHLEAEVESETVEEYEDSGVSAVMNTTYTCITSVPEITITPAEVEVNTAGGETRGDTTYTCESESETAMNITYTYIVTSTPTAASETIVAVASVDSIDRFFNEIDEDEEYDDDVFLGDTTYTVKQGGETRGDKTYTFTSESETATGSSAAVNITYTYIVTSTPASVDSIVRFFDEIDEDEE